MPLPYSTAQIQLPPLPPLRCTPPPPLFHLFSFCRHYCWPAAATVAAVPPPLPLLRPHSPLLVLRQSLAAATLIFWCPVSTGQRPQATRPEFLLRGHGRGGGRWACDKDGLARHAGSEGGQPAAAGTLLWPQNRPGYENLCRAPPEGSARLCCRKEKRQTATGSRVGGNRTTESRETGRKEARERESDDCGGKNLGNIYY